MKSCFGCDTILDLGSALSCAILICAVCRKDHDKLRLAREAMNRHLAEHKTQYRAINPYWPFLSRHEFAAFQEAPRAT